MNPRLAEFISEGMSLGDDEREIAALSLQEVSVAEQAEIDAEWDTEIDRRVAELVSGKVASVDGEETRRMARAILAARQA